MAVENGGCTVNVTSKMDLHASGRTVHKSGLSVENVTEKTVPLSFEAAQNTGI